MPQEAGYEQRLGPARTGVAPVQAGADAFGAGVGQAVEQLGGVLHRGAIDAYRLERRQKADGEASDFAAKFAATRTASDQISTDARNNAAPGAAGHAEAMTTWWQAQREQLVAGITEDSVRHRAEEALDDYGGRFTSREHDWQAGTATAKQVTDVQSTIGTSANRVRTAQHATAFGEEMVATLHSIDAMTGVPADVRDKLHRDAEQTLSVSQLDGMVDRGEVKAAAALLDSGAFDAILSPAQMDRARNDVRVQGDRIAAQERTTFNLGKSQAAASAELLLKQVAAGIDVPDDRIAAAQAEVTRYGEAGKAFDLATTRIENAVNRESRSWLPNDYDREVAELRAKRAAGKANGADQVRLAQIEKIAPGRKAEVAGDPFAFAATNGHPAPAVDAANPVTLQARGAWVDGMSQAMGRKLPLLSDAEAAPLVAIAQSGKPAEQAQLAQVILSAGRYAQPLADQVAGHNPGFRAAIGLAAYPGGLMQMALDGPAALAANKHLLTPGKDEAGQPLSGHETIFAGEAAKVMRALPAGYSRDTFYNATNLYATIAARAGWTQFHPGQFQRAIRLALGGRETGRGWEGGLGEWQGHRLILPRGMTEADMQRRLSRAGGAQWGAAGTNGAPWADGRALHAGELRGFAPVMVRDGIYALAQGNVFIRNRKGGRYEFDVRKLP